jgi:hypothetical protein
MMECLPETGFPSPEAFGKKVEGDLAAFKQFVESPQKRESSEKIFVN